MRDVPSSAERLNQLDRRGHGLSAERRELLLVGKQRGLRHQNVQILIYTRFQSCQANSRYCFADCTARYLFFDFLDIMRSAAMSYSTC